MARAKKKEKAEDPRDEEIDLGQLIDWVNEADDATVEARELAEKCRDYYDSKQYTDEEVRALKARKQAPVVVNRIKPKMDGLAGMERTNRTTAKAYPRTPKHTQDATAASEAVRYVLQDNFYQQIRSAVWDNQTIEGTGGCEIQVKPQGEGFRITITHIPWDRIIYDPHDRTKHFGQARYKGQVVWLDYDIALERFSDRRDVLESMIEGSNTYADKPQWMDTKRRRVKIVELYYQKDGDIWYACFTRGGFLKDPKKSPYVNEDGETEDPYEFGSLFVDREGNRYGAARQYLDVQDEINKRRSKALHLMSVRQVRWERGAVEDINVARKELAKPDGVIETTPGMEFEVLKTGDMAQAQFKLLEDAKLEIDAVGYSAAAAGKEERLMSGIALRNREAASQTELAPMFDVLRHLDIRVYRKVWNRIKQYWREEMWIRVTDDPSNVRFVGLNVQMTKGEMLIERAKAEGLPPEQLAALTQRVTADPMMQEKLTKNDIGELDVDIVLDDAPDSVTMQQEEFTALSEMVKSGIPVPPTAIIEASSLKNKDKILQEMRQGQVNPDAVKKLQEEHQKTLAENQQLKSDQQTEIAKVQMKAQADRENMRLKAEMQAEELRLERERAAAEIQLEREKAEAKIALERAIASAQMQIERERLAVEKEKAAHQTALAEKKQESDEKIAQKTAKAE